MKFTKSYQYRFLCVGFVLSLTMGCQNQSQPSSQSPVPQAPTISPSPTKSFSLAREDIGSFWSLYRSELSDEQKKAIQDRDDRSYIYYPSNSSEILDELSLFPGVFTYKYSRESNKSPDAYHSVSLDFFDLAEVIVLPKGCRVQDSQRAKEGVYQEYRYDCYGLVLSGPSLTVNNYGQALPVRLARYTVANHLIIDPVARTYEGAIEVLRDLVQSIGLIAPEDQESVVIRKFEIQDQYVALSHFNDKYPHKGMHAVPARMSLTKMIDGEQTYVVSHKYGKFNLMSDIQFNALP